MMKHEIKMEARFFTEEELEYLYQCLTGGMGCPTKTKLLEEW